MLRPKAKKTEWADQYRKPTNKLYPTPLTSPVPREPVSMRLMVRPIRAMIRHTKGKAVRPNRSVAYRAGLYPSCRSRST